MYPDETHSTATGRLEIDGLSFHLTAASEASSVDVTGSHYDPFGFFSWPNVYDPSNPNSFSVVTGQNLLVTPPYRPQDYAGANRVSYIVDLSTNKIRLPFQLYLRGRVHYAPSTHCDPWVGPSIVISVSPLPPTVVNVVTYGFNPELSSFNSLATMLDTLPQQNTRLHDRVGTYVTKWDSNTGFLSGLAFTVASEVLNVAGHPLAALGAKAAALALRAVATQLAEGAAQNIVNDLTHGWLGSPEGTKTGAPNQQIIDLIGHSRGAAVNALVAQLLMQRGYHVDQYTALDGYSTDWPAGSGIIGDLDITSTIPADVATKINYEVEQGLLGSACFGSDLKSFFGSTFLQSTLNALNAA
jgi:hypothetical protein